MFSWAVAFRIMSFLDSNRVPFIGIFSLGNSQKSQGAMSGVGITFYAVQHVLCDFQAKLLLLHR